MYYVEAKFRSEYCVDCTLDASSIVSVLICRLVDCRRSVEPNCNVIAQVRPWMFPIRLLNDETVGRAPIGFGVRVPEWQPFQLLPRHSSHHDLRVFHGITAFIVSGYVQKLCWEL